METTLPKDENRPDFTLAVTCYNEEKTLDEFFSAVKNALDSLRRTYEIVMVNDGSQDGTWEKLQSLFENEPCVRVVMDFFKNSGQTAALAACIREAHGRAIVLMDSDLQLEAADLPALVDEYDKGYDLVTGYRKNRQDPISRTIPSKLANVIMRRASQTKIRDFGCTYKVINGDLLRALEFGPARVFSNVELFQRVERVKEVPVTHRPRRTGKSGWTFAKLWRYNMENSMLALEKPFQYIAALSAIGALLLVIRVLAGFVSDARVLDEVTNGLLLNALAFTLLIITGILAVIGEFTVRNFRHLQREPAYIIRTKLEK